jgi:hypothetical protein
MKTVGNKLNYNYNQYFNREKKALIKTSINWSKFVYVWPRSENTFLIVKNFEKNSIYRENSIEIRYDT